MEALPKTRLVLEMWASWQQLLWWDCQLIDLTALDNLVQNDTLSQRGQSINVGKLWGHMCTVCRHGAVQKAKLASLEEVYQRSCQFIGIARA